MINFIGGISNVWKNVNNSSCKYGCQSGKSDLKKTHADSYTLVTKIVDMNYIVIN